MLALELKKFAKHSYVQFCRAQKMTKITNGGKRAPKIEKHASFFNSSTGQLSAVLCTVEAIVPIVCNPLYSAVYGATFDSVFPGVNFINITYESNEQLFVYKSFCTAFMYADPKSTKRQSSHQCLFLFLVICKSCS